MKKTILLLAAANLLWLGACESKKQQGEEYYDPNYKPGTSQSAPATTEPATEPAAEPATAELPATTPPPAGDAPVAVPDKASGEPAKASEAEVAVVPKDKLKTPPAGADVTKGKNLIAKSDCLACHKDDAKLVGPAYIDVAKKYEATDANIAKLADKIIKGGAGVWGQIPMSPHPGVSQGDAKEMVKYILSLNK